MKRFRKALAAGALAAAGIAGTQLVKDGLPANPDGWVALGVSLLGAFAVAALAVYNIKNANAAGV
jgi:hypothetical protein